ncbi:MAG: M81 family metallopeptidase [Abditibacteriaceae bacterium]
MNKKYRIAVGSFLTECNHLGGQPTDLHRFEITELKYGAAILQNPSGAMIGIIEALQAVDVEIVPLMVATACPGAPLTAECWDTLKSQMLNRVQAALPLDGVVLSLHGSAAAENSDDPEGDLLFAIKEITERSTPIAATLDPHGNVTGQMVQNSDILLGWKTYPHVDAPQTGSRAAQLLLEILDGKITPRMALAKVSVLVSGVNGTTEKDANGKFGPFGRVMNFANSLEGHDGVLAASVFLVHPYLDLPEMGGGGLVITDDNAAVAHACASEIALRYWDERFALEPKTYSPREAIEEGLQIEGGPVLLVECADCCGGGAAGDSAASLRALLDAGVDELSLVPIVDPQAAQLCHEAGEGAELEFELGHKLDTKWGKPLKVRGKVLRCSDGRFTYSGGFWKGIEGQMGRSALFQVGAIQVLITTNATYEWADEQFAALGMDVSQAKFVVVKNPMNYQIGYAKISKAAFILDTPGPTPATLKNAGHKRVARPYFPRDADIESLIPEIYLQ